MSKRARTPRGRHGRKLPSVDDLPNPAAVAALQVGAKQAMDDITTGMDTTKPGLDIMREILPATLLMHAPKDAEIALELDDGTTIPVRHIDMQTAGLAMFAKTMAKLGNEVLARSGGKPSLPIRLFDGEARAAALRSAPPAPPARQEVEASDAGSDDEATAKPAAAVKEVVKAGESTMSLPKEIKQLFALAANLPGPVPQPKMRDATVKKKPINPQHPEAVATAKPAAEAIFAWLAGPVGDEIRAEMKESGAKLIPLHGWRICITPAEGMLHTRRENNPQMGNFDSTRVDVTTPEDLIKAVGPEIVCSVHQAIVDDHVFKHMAAHLRQLSGGAGA